MDDLRVTRTHVLLKNALFELMSKKSFEDIKINDICNNAMIHRTTFYSHFSDKYELLEYCISEVEKDLTKKISEGNYSNLREFYSKLIMNLLGYISDHKKLFKNILKYNSYNGIVNIFMNASTSYITNVLEKEKNRNITHNIPISLISEFYSGAFIHTIIYWLKTDSNLSEKELCNYIISLIFDSPHN